MPTAPKMSLAGIDQAATEIAENFVVLDPDAPTPTLAARIVDELESELSSELSRSLMIGYFVRLVRRVRRKPIERPSELVLFEHVPLRIVGRKDRRVALVDATYTDLLRYEKLIGRRHRDRRKSDQRLAEIKVLIEQMRRASKKQHGVTVGEVLGIKRRQPPKENS